MAANPGLKKVLILSAGAAGSLFGLNQQQPPVQAQAQSQPTSTNTTLPAPVVREPTFPPSRKSSSSSVSSVASSVGEGEALSNHRISEIQACWP